MIPIRFVVALLAIVLFGSVGSEAFAQRTVVRQGVLGRQVVRVNGGGQANVANVARVASVNAGHFVPSVAVANVGHCGSSAQVFAVPAHFAPVQTQFVPVQTSGFSSFSFQSFSTPVPSVAVQNFSGFGGVQVFSTPVHSQGVLIQSSGCGSLLVR